MNYGEMYLVAGMASFCIFFLSPWIWALAVWFSGFVTDKPYDECPVDSDYPAKQVAMAIVWPGALAYYIVVAIAYVTRYGVRKWRGR